MSFSDRTNKDIFLDMNKPRLYVALYALGGELGGTFPTAGQPREYHWALLVAPKNETPETMGKRWLFRPRLPHEEADTRRKWTVKMNDVKLKRHQNILVRIMIGKIKNWSEAIKIIGMQGGEPMAETHRTWIKAIIRALREDGSCCKHVPEWEDVEDVCDRYADQKIYHEECFNGDDKEVPTLDMIFK